MTQWICWFSIDTLIKHCTFNVADISLAIMIIKLQILRNCPQALVQNVVGVFKNVALIKRALLLVFDTLLKHSLAAKCYVVSILSVLV